MRFSMILALLVACGGQDPDPKGRDTDTPTDTDTVVDTDTETDTDTPVIDSDGDGVPEGEDCDDADPDRFPGNPEICDDVDNDCNELVDDGLVFTDWYADDDGDGEGAGDVAANTCHGAPSGMSETDGDCDDDDDQAFPCNPEVCDDIDNDCVGGIDDGLTFVDYYTDSDGDGAGAGAIAATTCDGAPLGTSPTGDDCDDANPYVNPAEVEICDGIDNDCAGGIDDGLLFVDHGSAGPLRWKPGADCRPPGSRGGRPPALGPRHPRRRADRPRRGASSGTPARRAAPGDRARRRPGTTAGRGRARACAEPPPGRPRRRRSVPAREGSWERLDVYGQRLLAALSVFRGPFLRRRRDPGGRGHPRSVDPPRGHRPTRPSRGALWRAARHPGLRATGPSRQLPGLTGVRVGAPGSRRARRPASRQRV